MNASFDINISDMYWIDRTKNNPNDLCLHGDVSVRIGKKLVADNYSCTISSTALYLLKSLSEDHKIGEVSNQMLPCCGHTIIPDEKEDVVEIIGCPNGVDWNVMHFEDNVELSTQNGTKVMMELIEYREIVIMFVDQVQEFYDQSVARDIPRDNYERDAYGKFWKEWKARRNNQK